MSVFLTRTPSAVQVVVSSRRDPSFPVARLRAHDELTEIRAGDLRLTREGAEAMLREAGVRLTTRNVKRLHERTEGWLAGLWLAVLALKEHQQPDRFVHEFSGDTRYVFDYLARDVLATTDAEGPATSWCDRRCSTACRPSCATRCSREPTRRPRSRESTARTSSWSRSTQPARSTATTISLPPSCGESSRRSILRSTRLHARASISYEQRGDLEHAVDHAIASRDVARASTLVTRLAVPLLSAGRMATLNRWFDLLSWPEARAIASWQPCARSPRD